MAGFGLNGEMFRHKQAHCINNQEDTIMILRVIQKIPFIIPIVAIVDTAIIKIISARTLTAIAILGPDFPLKKQMSAYIRMRFIRNSPIFFNYWLIYIAIATIIAIVLLCTKQLTLAKAAMAMLFNIGAGFLVLYYIATTQ